MKTTKDDKGITLVALIVTVIVMLIIASVSIYSNTGDIEKSSEQIEFAELEQVKYLVGEVYLNYTKTKNTNFLIGTKITENEANTLAEEIGVRLITIPSRFNKQTEAAYYRLEPENLTRIGVVNPKDTYIVNYVTGEVINETKLTTNSGVALYTYLRDNFDGDVTTSLNQNELNEIEREKDIFNSL